MANRLLLTVYDIYEKNKTRKGKKNQNNFIHGGKERKRKERKKTKRIQRNQQVNRGKRGKKQDLKRKRNERRNEKKAEKRNSSWKKKPGCVTESVLGCGEKMGELKHKARRRRMPAAGWGRRTLGSLSTSWNRIRLAFPRSRNLESQNRQSIPHLITSFLSAPSLSLHLNGAQSRSHDTQMTRLSGFKRSCCLI